MCDRLVYLTVLCVSTQVIFLVFTNFVFKIVFNFFSNLRTALKGQHFDVSYGNSHLRANAKWVNLLLIVYLIHCCISVIKIKITCKFARCKVEIIGTHLNMFSNAFSFRKVCQTVLKQ